MKSYIGVKIVQAELESKDGKEGFKVIYEEGYESWCPKDVFLKHNRPTDALPFSHALEAVKQRKRIARKGWTGKNMWLELQVPDEQSKMSLPYLYIEYPAGHPAYPQGSRVPWLASQTDLLADDWFIVT
jgi:hypothetical protein